MLPAAVDAVPQAIHPRAYGTPMRRTSLFGAEAQTLHMPANERPDQRIICAAGMTDVARADRAEPCNNLASCPTSRRKPGSPKSWPRQAWRDSGPSTGSGEPFAGMTPNLWVGIIAVWQHMSSGQ